LTTAVLISETFSSIRVSFFRISFSTSACTRDWKEEDSLTLAGTREARWETEPEVDCSRDLSSCPREDLSAEETEAELSED